jgi:hypothetical protein
MSRFADMLKKALQSTPPSMGFKPVIASCKPRMALVASTSQVDGISSMVQGADAVIVNAAAGISAKSLKSLAKALSDIPWGLSLEGDGQNLKQIDNSGADFIAFAPHKMTLAVLENEKLGKVLFIDPAMEDNLLRAGNELPFEAVILNRQAVALTWQDLMLFRKLADMLPKPLLVPVLADIKPSELKALWESGVDGIVVEARAEKELAGIRKTMDGLTILARRKWLKIRPLVPLMREDPGLAPEEDDGEEEDDS